MVKTVASALRLILNNFILKKRTISTVSEDTVTAFREIRAYFEFRDAVFFEVKLKMKRNEKNFDFGDVERLPPPLPIEAEFSFEVEEERTVEYKWKKRIAILVTALLLLLATVVTVWIFIPKNAEDNVEDLPTIQDTELEEWRGAFLAKKIYENCMANTVVIRVERGSGGSFWSGFVLSEDGFIVTSLKDLDKTKGGRLYVVLNGEKEYLVDSIRIDRDSSLAILKISADGLTPTVFRDDEVQCGEEIISVGACADNSCQIASGEVSGIDGELLKVNIPLGIQGIGAPLFDENGKLVGIACSSGIEGVDSAISAKKGKEILLSMRGK